MTLYNTSKHKVFRCSKTTTKVKRDRTRQHTYKTRHTQNKHSQKNKRNGGIGDFGRVTKRMKKSLSKSDSMGFGSRRLQWSRFRRFSSTELVALSETIYDEFFMKFDCINTQNTEEEEEKNIKANIRVLMYNVLRKQKIVDFFVAYKMIEICVPFVQKRIKTYIDDHEEKYLEIKFDKESADDTKKIRKIITDQYNLDKQKTKGEHASEDVRNNYTVNIQTLFTEIIQSTFDVLKMSKKLQIWKIMCFVERHLWSILTLPGGSLLLAEHFANHCSEMKMTFFSSWRIQSVLLYYSIVYKGQLSATHIIGGISAVAFLGFLCIVRISGTKAIVSGVDWFSNQYAHFKDELWHKLPKSIYEKHTTLARTQAEFLGTCVYLISCKTSYDFLSEYNSNVTETQPLQRLRQRQFIAYSDNLLKSHKKMQQKKNKRESEKMFQKVIDSITQDDEDYEYDESVDLDALDRLRDATEIIRQIIQKGTKNESTDITDIVSRLQHIDGSTIVCSQLRTMIYRNLNKANIDNTNLVSNIFRNVQVKIYKVSLLGDIDNTDDAKIWETGKFDENNLYVVECTASGKSINKQKYFFANEMWNHLNEEQTITLKGKKYTKLDFGHIFGFSSSKDDREKLSYKQRYFGNVKGVSDTIDSLKKQEALVVSDIVRDNYLYIFRRPENKKRVKWNNWIGTKNTRKNKTTDD